MRRDNRKFYRATCNSWRNADGSSRRPEWKTFDRSNSSLLIQSELAPSQTPSSRRLSITSLNWRAGEIPAVPPFDSISRADNRNNRQRVRSVASCWCPDLHRGFRRCPSKGRKREEERETRGRERTDGVCFCSTLGSMLRCQLICIDYDLYYLKWQILFLFTFSVFQFKSFVWKYFFFPTKNSPNATFVLFLR